MELVVKQIPKIEKITFNYEELKVDLIQRVSEYKTVVYTADTIKTAKTDRAALNKLKKAMNDERIRLEKEYMEPFADFKAKVTELCQIVDEASSAIDKQVKDYEELQKKEKAEAIAHLFDNIVAPEFPWLKIEQIWNEKWLNASYKSGQIENDMADKMAEIKNSLAMLDRIDEYSFEAKETYKQCLKIDDALWQVDHLKQMAAAKKEEEAQKAATQTEPAQPQEIQTSVEDFMPKPENANTGESEPQRSIISFRCYVTMEEAIKLSHFMKAEGIKFERI